MSENLRYGNGTVGENRLKRLNRKLRRHCDSPFIVDFGQVFADWESSR